MLDQLASHGLFDVHVRATSNTHIDDHHTNEDVALAIGTALLQALGGMKGINRFGDFSAPLDEALIHVTLDMFDRPYLGYDLQIPTERVGTYDTRLVEHFFQSLVNTSGMTLHIMQLAGRNSHHIIEATFKAFARALRQATEYDARRTGSIPSIKLDVRELGIQFGCVRLIPLVRKGLSLYKERFLASLPATRRSSTDFNRLVFTVVAFYLCAKKYKLKVDKIKLVELCGTSESEFSSISTSMMDLCFDVFGVMKEKKDAKEVKGNRELLDVFPKKRRCDLSDDKNEPSCHKKRKQMEQHDYDEWKSTVLSSNNQEKDTKCVKKASKQFRLNF